MTFQADIFRLVMDNVTLPAEGGWSDNPDDPGGATNRGLTLPDLRQFCATATAADLAGLTINQTLGIYYALYWLPVKGASLPPAIACMVFDHAVNAGIGCSVRLLQEVLGVDQDGIIGPKTLAAVGLHAVRSLLERPFSGLVSGLQKAQHADYAAKGDAGPFLTGWLNRLDARTKYAQTLL